MKKITTLVMGVLAAIGLASCDKAPETPAPAPEKGKVLVAYFSASGNTRAVAEKMAKGLEADLFEIAPVELYTDADLDYKNQQSRSYVEMHDDASRPEMKAKVEDMGKYDVVCIGYPIWWGMAPHIVYNFVESHDLAGKKVIPFCTAGSGGIANSVELLHKVDASGSKWSEGAQLKPGDSQEEITAWALKQLGSIKD